MQWDEFRVFGSAFFWFLEEGKKKGLRWKRNQSTTYVGVLTDYGWRTTKRDVDQWSMPTIKILWKDFRIQENGLIDYYMWKEETVRRDRSRHGAIRYIYLEEVRVPQFFKFFFRSCGGLLCESSTNRSFLDSSASVIVLSWPVGAALYASVVVFDP